MLHILNVVSEQQLDNVSIELESVLNQANYLVSTSFTLADAYGISCVSFVYSILGAEYAGKFPRIYKWFQTNYKNGFFSGRYESFQLPEKPFSPVSQ